MPVRTLEPLRKGAHKLRGVSWTPILCTVILVTFAVMALFADQIAPHGALDSDLSNRLAPPAWHGAGSWTHPLGTDDVGRDVFSRIVYGARSSLMIMILTIVIGGGVGTMIGIVGGYFGGFVDAVLLRLADTAMALPIVLIAILMAVALGPSITNVVIAIALLMWARFARVIRGEVQRVARSDYVSLAVVAGCSSSRIIATHVIPNVANTAVVLLSLQIGTVILFESSLSFLGAGIPPPTPAWGSMVAAGRSYVISAYWVSLMPGLAIMLIVLACNMLGDWLRDRLDPKFQ